MLGARKARLPNALIIGAQKCGTTALYQQLAAHPDVFACAPKEPHFFSHNYGRPRDMDAYRALFVGAGDEPVVLEASTTYSMFPLAPGTPTRIRDALGDDVRLIYCMREPLARTRAAYIHSLSAGTETRAIGDALSQDLRLVSPSLYGLQLERFLEVFPRDQILCLRHEDMRTDPAACLDTVLQFLDLEPNWDPPTFGTVNVSADKRMPRPWWRRLGGLRIQYSLGWMNPLFHRIAAHPDWVSRTITENETRIPDDIADALRVLFRGDLVRLRSLLGEGWDWGHLSDDFAAMPASTARAQLTG